MTNQEIQVHKTHCCVKCGCKYNDKDCPVVDGTAKQEFECIECVSQPDIKYLNIPNICFSLAEKDDRREEEFKKQRIERGFDDSELWSLTGTIAKFIIPRLEKYQEISEEVLERDQNTLNKIDTFLKAMKLITRDDESWTFNEEEEKIVDKGLKAFPEIFMRLWW